MMEYLSEAFDFILYAAVALTLLAAFLLASWAVVSTAREASCELFRFARVGRMQFSLRTLFLAFSFAQVFLAVMLWQTGLGKGWEEVLIGFGFCCFFVWAIWNSAADFWRPTISRQWSHKLRPERIAEPVENNMDEANEEKTT